MKHTETPVYRPTAACIWNSFLSSNKKHLILTGSRGSGKSTRLEALLPSPAAGIRTWAEPGNAVYMQELPDRNTAVIGRFDPAIESRENRMRPCGEGFLSFGIPALKRLSVSGSEWVFIDEIGYLEADFPEYCAGIRALMEKKRLIAAVRKQDLPFLKETCGRNDVFLVDLDDPYGKIGCVIMASGMGVRFGGNKLMADFHGVPMVKRIMDATNGIFKRRVLVTRHENVAQLSEKCGIPAILHELPHRNDTVRLGIREMEGMDGCIFCPGDQPLLQKDSIAALALAAANDAHSIWRLCCEGTDGTPVYFPAWAFEELASLPEGKGGGWIAKKYPEQVRRVPVQDKWELKDADSAEDLYALLER